MECCADNVFGDAEKSGTQHESERRDQQGQHLHPNVAGTVNAGKGQALLRLRQRIGVRGLKDTS